MMTEDLHAQLAQRLFGWRWEDAAGLWRDPDGVYRDAATFRRRLPAYTTDPAATAQVWQWVEGQARWRLNRLTVEYFPATGHRLCRVTSVDGESLQGTGATWPQALCRAALALAAALEEETPRE